MKLFSFLLVSVLTVYYSIAQECQTQLIVNVVDFHNGAPLPDSSVRIFGKDATYTTDGDGLLVIKNLCKGIIELEVSHDNCKTRFQQVRIHNNPTTVEVKLEHHVEELEAATVNASGKPKKTTSSQEETLTSDIIQRYGSQTLGDALKSILGVSSLNTGNTIVKPVIQGLRGSRVLMLNNGVRMQDMEWGDEHAPNVDINAFGSITVVKGAAALKYGGDAIGGVIVAESSRIPAKDTLFGRTNLTLGSNGRGGSISSDLVKSTKSGFYAEIGGTYKRFGDFETQDYILSNTGNEEKAFTARLGLNKFVYGFEAYYSFIESDIGVLRASHLGNVDDLIRAINSDIPLFIEDFTYDIDRPSQNIRHHLGKVKIFKRFEELGKLDIQYDFQLNRRFEFDIRVGSDRDKPALDLELTTHTLTSDFVVDANPNYKLNAGLLFRYQENFANPDTGVRRLIPDYEKLDVGAYLSGNYYVTDNLLLDAGVRYDFNTIDAKKFYRTSRWIERGYDQDFADIIVEDLGTQLLTNPKFDYHNISATIGAQYLWENDTELRFNYALSSRTPNPSELFSDGLHHSAARIELGDLRIDKEVSHKLSASLQGRGTQWSWEIAPYFNHVNDFILLEPTGVEFTIRGAFPVWEYIQTDARLLGIDTRVTSNWSENFSSDHGFSMVKGRDLSNDRPLINIPATSFSNQISYTNEKWLGFNFTLESQYHLRQNETPDDIMVFSPVQNQEVLLAINTAPDGYHVLNSTMDIEFPLFQKKSMAGVGLSFNNILNQRYRDYLNRQRYFADDLGRNILLRLRISY